MTTGGRYRVDGVPVLDVARRQGRHWMVGADTTWPGYLGRRQLGNIRGIDFAVGIAGAAIGPVPFGISFDVLGSYNAAILALMPLPLIAALPSPVVGRRLSEGVKIA